MTKILYYNWVDYLDDEKRGGGVSVYQRNLIRAITKNSEVDVFFLSAGISYDFLFDRPRWTRIRHGGRENRRRRFEIVNSAVLSPAHYSFGDFSQCDDQETIAAFLDFAERNGPFDIFHFNNLEGIPASVLSAIRGKWPKTKIFVSLHNYYPFCSQVNLWFQEQQHCTDFDEGRRCTRCLTKTYDQTVVRRANALAFLLKRIGIRPGTRLFSRLWIPAFRVSSLAEKIAARAFGIRRATGPKIIHESRSLINQPAKQHALQPLGASAYNFKRRRQEFVRILNDSCDLILCPSARTAALAQHYGLRPDRIRVCYIGTNEARKFFETAPRSSILREDGTLGLGYLGYMRRDKGFYFLLEAFEKMPRELAARIHLIVAAPATDSEAVKRLQALTERCASVLFADGYTHETLDAILAEVDVGVIPVLWEDNLPQVAIEMHARHIPLLVSDMGGAQELANCPEMIFRAGNRFEFYERLRALLAEEITSARYWSGPIRRPVTMEEHLEELRALYGLAPGEAPATGALVPEAAVRIAPPGKNHVAAERHA